jgi:hypothetical protein
MILLGPPAELLASSHPERAPSRTAFSTPNRSGERRELVDFL